MQTVILAGGKGTRLYPFTITLPKPLVPVGDQPILEILIKQLVNAGVTEVVLSVGHLSQLIMAYFGTGDKFNVPIRYVNEDQPLGTAGPLSIIPNLEENFLVSNGDILTTLNFKELFDFHVSQENDLTVALHRKHVKIDLGVVEVDGSEIVSYEEKPVYTYLVSMGIYAMNREVVGLLEQGKQFDLPDLVMLAKRRGLKVQCYTRVIPEMWLDIGNPDDYARATELFQANKGAFFP